MKYISMKMEPKGNRPPMRAMTRGRRYQARAGTGLGMRFTRQGLSGSPFQLRPTTCMHTTFPVTSTRKCTVAGRAAEQ